ARWGTFNRGASGDAMNEEPLSPADRLAREIGAIRERRKAASEDDPWPHVSRATRPLEPLKGRYIADPPRPRDDKAPASETVPPARALTTRDQTAAATQSRPTPDGAKEPTRLRYRLELPAGEALKIDDLPGLWAAAVHGDNTLARVAMEDSLRRTLPCDVLNGTIQPLNPLTLTRHEFPVGDGLWSAVLLPHSLGPILGRVGIELVQIEPGNGPQYWCIRTAARDLGDIQGWNRKQVDMLREQMLDAARNGALVVRSPQTELPVPLHKRETVRDFYELVTREDVNVWLVSVRAPYRWVTYEQAASEPRFIAGRRLWKLADAIETVAAMPGFGVSAEALRARVQRDAEQQRLTLRDQEHGGEVRSDWAAVVLGWHLFAEDFNAWLEAAGFREPY
ncbi:MAG: hypothetical protein ACK5QX_04285, partial [bacterium]